MPHKWEVKEDTGKYEYLECSQCHDRTIRAKYETGHQPIKHDWTNGKRPSLFCNVPVRGDK